MQYILLACLISFGVSVLIGYPIILWLRKLRARQTILEYVEMHKDKQGTPTMGGIIILVGLIAGSLIALLGSNSMLGLMTILVTLGYGLLGFLDDYIKITNHQNEGLKPYQKIIGQGGIAMLIGIFCYTNPLVPKILAIPFTDIGVDVGIWIIPIVIFVYISLVNAVNLIDGLDGLCSGTSASYLLGFVALLMLTISNMYSSGSGEVILTEFRNIGVVCGALFGSLLGFLCFNSHKANVFMGDVGSLAIGGLLTSVAVFSGLVLYVPFLGIMFVITAVSVLIQVLHYKRTKERVFLMAPLHHHFEKKGVYETKIVSIYIIITIIMGVATVLLTPI